jgi:hypothetical protein
VFGGIQLPKKKALAVSATGLSSGFADAAQGKNVKGLHGSEVGRSGEWGQLKTERVRDDVIRDVVLMSGDDNDDIREREL